MKKKILIVNEASYLSTGFSVYGHELLSRLYQNDKYEVAEFAAYGEENPAERPATPWKFYPNVPSDPEELKAYEAKPSNAFGEWRFERVCLDFKPHIVVDWRDWWFCLSPYTTIVCDKGVTTAAEVQVGDNLLTHTGRYRKVVRTFSRSYNGRMIKLKASHSPLPIYLTEQHPVLAIKRNGNPSLPEFKASDLSWIDSDKIEKGDIVCFPVNTHDALCVNDSFLDLCRLLGYYAAEGCLMYQDRKELGILKGIQLVFHIDEERFVSDVKQLIKKLYNVNITIRRKDNTLIVRAFSRILAEDINKYMPGLAGTKVLHTEIYNLPNEYIRQFLCGLFRGDGYYSTKSCVYCTKSKQLAFQIFQLCLRQGMLPSFCYNKNKLRGKTFYKYSLEFSTSNAIGFRNIFNNTGDIPQSNRIKDGYAFLTIKDVEHYTDNCIVYNFEVEDDNSYVSAFCLHNCEFIERSPFRPYFKWIEMPTVDSSPQDEQWIATYMNADAILAYSEFGYETLAKEGGGLIKLQGMASPGANLEDFRFVEDKASCKKAVGLAEDAIIIGTVMRNQERKLYPDLIEAFAQFLKEAPKNIADKSFLYLHTSYPDVGWHLPRFIKEYQLANRVLFTYICRTCGHIFPAFYQDARTFCKRCKDYSAILPGVRGGLTRDSLGKIMNLFDVYVQYAVCEGFGMPLVEAACTGTVCMAVDYSAMADIIRKINGIPIKVQRMFYDPRTHSKRALPDNQDLIKKLISILQLSPAERLERIKFSRQAVEKHYNWDHTVKVWEDCFDRLEVIADQQSWGAPSRASNPVMQMPEGLTNDEFVQWAIMNIAGRPELLNGYIPLRLTRDLNWGAHQAGPGGMWYNDASYGSMQVKWEPYNRKDVIEELLRANAQKNAWEEQRIASK